MTTPLHLSGGGATGTVIGALRPDVAEKVGGNPRVVAPSRLLTPTTSDVPDEDAVGRGFEETVLAYSGLDIEVANWST